MADDVLIGEISRNGSTVLLYASADVHSRVVVTDYNYSGLCDEADRNLQLIEAVQEALDRGQSALGIEVDDRSWSGRPEDIERERIALRLDIGTKRVLVHMRAKSIAHDDPAYAVIATRALEALNQRGFHRNV